MSNPHPKPGPGRPKGSKANHTLLAERGKAALIKAYLDNVIPINQALVDKAKGGDIQAIRELHDRVWGRAPQDVQVSGEISLKLDV